MSALGMFQRAVFKKSASLPPGPGFRAVLEFGVDPIYGPMRLQRDFGPIVHLPMGPDFMPVYVVSDPDMVHQVLVKHRDHYIKDRIFKWMSPVFGDGILIIDGEKWKRARRMMTPAFRPRSLRGYGEVMLRSTREAQARLDLSAGFNIEAWTRDLTLDIALKTLFGASLGDKAERVSTALDDLLQFADGAMQRITRPVGFLPTRSNRSLWRGMEVLNEVIDEILEERAQSDAEHDDLLAMLLSARDADGSELSAQDIHDQVITLLLAGHETTALSIAYSFMVLGWNPRVVERLHQEIDEVIGDRAVEVEDLRNFTYLNMVIQEVLRMYPPAAITAREVAEDDTISGYTLPKGAQVYIPIWGIHHDRRYWERPYTFDPERWRPEEVAKRPRYSFFPFGGGNRVCIGEQFARMEMQIVLVTLLQQFTPRTLIDTPPALDLAITMRPATPIRMELQPRV